MHERKNRLSNSNNAEYAVEFTCDVLLYCGIGICALVAGTNTAFAAFVLGLATLITLLFSRAIVIITRRVSPTNEKAYRLYSFIITACFGTIAKMIIERFMPVIANDIGKVALWMISLGIAFLHVNKRDDLNAKRAYTGDLVFGIIYWMLCTFIGIVREFLTRGSIFNIEISENIKFPGLDTIWFSILLLGLVFAIMKSCLLKTKVGKKLENGGEPDVGE